MKPRPQLVLIRVNYLGQSPWFSFYPVTRGGGMTSCHQLNSPKCCPAFDLALTWPFTLEVLENLRKLGYYSRKRLYRA